MPPVKKRTTPEKRTTPKKGSSKSKSRRPRRNWTDKMNERLRKLYPTVSWARLEKAFPNHKRGAIVQQACRLGLQRPPRVTKADVQKKGMAAAEPEPVTDEQMARYMTHGRSVKDLAKAFKMTEQEADQRLKNGFQGYDLFLGPKNLAGEQTFVAVPSCGEIKKQERAWQWTREPNGQPYGVVRFPADFNHQKIRIIPIDRICYGAQDHDAERFDAILNKLAREPNTFCWLNGDIITELKGGKKEERERALVALAAAFSEKMRPIAHKILFAQQGCFEERSLRNQGFDPLAHFCYLLNIPYFREPVYIDLYWGDHLFTIWTMHGHSVAQLKGSKINALRRPAQIHEYTNFMIMGHIGDSIWNRVPKVCRNPARGALEQREEFHIILGSFTKYLGTRSARRGEIPPSNETIVLYLYPDGDTHVKTEHGGES